jgi:hypothetical protein
VAGLGLVILLSLILLPAVQGQTQQYSIALEGVKWTTQTISLEIPHTPDYAYSAVLNAMYSWNQAQKWFNEEYYPNQALPIYNFTESANSQNTVLFLTSVEMQKVYQGAAGFTECIASRGQIRRGIVYFDVNFTLYLLEPLATHELGHLLGLGHVLNQSAATVDVMGSNGDSEVSANVGVPSTLDLYALHIIQSSFPARVPRMVTLASTIPFTYASILATPEFSLSPVLITVFFFCVVIGRKSMTVRTHKKTELETTTQSRDPKSEIAT